MADSNVIEMGKRGKKKEEAEAKPSKTKQLQTSLDMLVTELREYCADNDIAFGFGGGMWHIYRNGFWSGLSVDDMNDFDRILSQLCPNCGLVFGRDASMIYRHLRAAMHFRISAADFDAQPYVVLRNGALNLLDRELIEHSPEHMVTRHVDIDYDPDAKCPEWEKILADTLSELPEEAQKPVAGFLQEWMGVALVGGATSRTPRGMRKALFLYGPPRAGKSTIYDVIRLLLGSDKIVSSRVSEVNSRFGLESFLTAQAWITEEVDDTRKDMATSRVKCLITGEPLNVQRKGTQDATLQFNGPVGWAGNTAPKFSESSGAVYDRITVVPMERLFTDKEAMKRFGKMKPAEWLREQGELPGIFNWALAGYNRLLERGHFEKIPALAAAAEEWRDQNDPFFAFVRDYCGLDPTVYNTSRVLGVAAKGYMASQGATSTLNSIQSSLASVIPEVYPSVQKRRQVLKSGKHFTYSGLRLSDAGVALLKNQIELHPHLEKEDLKANEPVVF